MQLAPPGGAISPDEVHLIEQEPWFRLVVAVRRWDDAAKVPGLAVPGLDHYLPFLGAVLLKPEGE